MQCCLGKSDHIAIISLKSSLSGFSTLLLPLRVYNRFPLQSSQIFVSSQKPLKGRSLAAYSTSSTEKSSRPRLYQLRQQWLPQFLFPLSPSPRNTSLFSDQSTSLCTPTCLDQATTIPTTTTTFCASFPTLIDCFKRSKRRIQITNWTHQPST